MIVLIPAFEPDHKLLTVILELRDIAPSFSVLVIDDGSGPAFAHVFESARTLGATVVSYPINSGKGHALKVGFRYLLRHHPDQDVVCADSDGQHSTVDILRIAGRVNTARSGATQTNDSTTMVLGSRRFTGTVPLRSALGNSISRKAFSFASGLKVHDTQTGLRAYPAAMLPWLASVRGDRFDYELNTLLESSAAGWSIEEVEIETIYLDHNESSHFRPIVDSLRVTLPLIRFGSSSLLAFAVDLLGLLLLFTTTHSLLVSVVGARLLSGTLNFLVNRQLVFRAAQPRRVTGDALRYICLALLLLASSYFWLKVLTTVVGIPLLPAKLITDVALYFISFQAQRRFVFGRRGKISIPHNGAITTATPAQGAATSESGQTAVAVLSR